MEEVRIAILDTNDDVLTFMDNTSKSALHYYSDELAEYLKGTAATFNFSVPASHEDSVYLSVGNKISFRLKERDYYLNIMRTERTEEEVNVETYSLSFELLNEIREKYKAANPMTFVEYMEVIDPEQTLTIGTNEVSDKRITHEWEGEDTILSRIFSLATVFSAEVEFIPELNDDYSLRKITMNVYREHSDSNQGVGKSEGVVIRYGKEVSGITKTSDITELYTAIKPVGKDGLTVTSITKEELDQYGNVEYQTPVNSPYIYAVQARDRFPSNLMSRESDRYILEQFEYDTDNVNTLYGQALAKLKKDCVPVVEYNVEGYFNTGIGDTVTIVDEEYTPELYLETRVTEQHRSFTDPSTNKTVFDNFRELQSQVDTSLIARVEELIAQNKQYVASISTDNGIVFKNEVGDTTLTAHVRDSGGIELSQDYQIHWYKDNEEVYIGNPYTIKSEDIDGKAVIRFDATDVGQNVKASFEVTVSNVNDGTPGEDGATPEIGSNGNWVINGEDTGKPSQGKDGEPGEPSGITVSPTEPDTKYTGMLWKHTGTVSGLIKNATYRWTGTTWELYIFMAENIHVDALSALTANLGKVTAGSIDISWEYTNNDGRKVRGKTSLSGEAGGSNPLFMSYTEYSPDTSAAVGNGYSRHDFDGFMAHYESSGLIREVKLTPTGLFFSDDGVTYTGIEKTDLQKMLNSSFDEGEKDGWVYRKWKNGKLECWKTVTLTPVSTGTWGSGFAFHYNNQFYYPVTFISTPVEIVTLGKASTGDMWLCATGDPGDNVRTGKYQTVRLSNTSTDLVKAKFNYYAFGRWY